MIEKRAKALFFGPAKATEIGYRIHSYIHRSDLLKVLARIEARDALSIAEKVRLWFINYFALRE